MDLLNSKAYNYLCHLEECRRWLQIVLQENIPSPIELEKNLCNGVLLAKLGHFINPKLVPISRIFDIDLSRYKSVGLCFRHTDNINYWLTSLSFIQLPKIFHPVTTDVYNNKNTPRLIYCIHALSIHLYRLGKAPPMQNLLRRITFPEADLIAINDQLEKYGIDLPPFHNVAFFLDSQLNGNYDTSHNFLTTPNLNILSMGRNEYSEDHNHLYQSVENNLKHPVQPIKTLDYYVQKLNHELQEGTQTSFYEVLKCSEFGFSSELLDPFCIPLYFEELMSEKLERNILTFEDIKNGINFLFKVASVSEAVDNNDPENLWAILSEPSLKIQEAVPRLKEQYLRALGACRRYKQLEKCCCTLLSYINIQDCVDLVNSHNGYIQGSDLYFHLTEAVIQNDLEEINNIINDPHMKLNKCVKKCDIQVLQYCLQKQLNSYAEGTELNSDDLSRALDQCTLILQQLKMDIEWICSINISIANNDFNHLRAILLQYPGINEAHVIAIMKCVTTLTEANTGSSDWVDHFTTEGYPVYINVHTGLHSWIKPTMTSLSSRYLSVQQLKEVISKIISCDLMQIIVSFQSVCRGYLIRSKLKKYQFYVQNVENIIKIQKWWRYRIRNRRNCKKQNPYNFDLQRKEKCACKIQALWRGYHVRKIFNSVYYQPEPPYKALKMFFTLIDINTSDYERELQLQMLRSDVVQAIRRNQQLMNQVDKMDITIGLLVQNRISLMEAVVENNKLNVGGLKCLRADSRRLLEGYQHLFYTLQTSPHYLARLLFCLPQSKSTNFLQSVILSLYNFGANHRNEYLLLKLFQRALHEEIRCKFIRPSDVITGNPLVLKMAVNYARQTSGHNALQHILAPLLHKVLNTKEASIDTNPVSIYNYWRNQLEMESGKVSELPYSVNQEEALKYEEVQCRLNNGIKSLKVQVLMFMKRITGLKDAIPYGLRFIAKELVVALSTKFPDAPEKEILKVVGNLLYYQFINSAIVAPDAFDIITLPANQTLSSEQRHTLASIAKILQFAAAKKGFGEESKHLMCLNPFISECHEKFKQFFKECCDVEDIDSHYSMTEFTEATMIIRPTIYITLQEIVETHSLLIDYEQEIAPDNDDKLRELLSDLGPVPSLSQLAGQDCDSVLSERQVAQTEVCLTLSNKFEAREDNTDLTKLFIRAKELMCILLPYLSGHTLPGALRMEPNASQEQAFSSRKLRSLHPSYIGSLRDCKAKLRKVLAHLSEEGLVSREDGYQNILTAIASDIRNSSKYRQIQAQELNKLRSTKKSLEEKTAFFKEQISYYNAYIERCLENLNAGKRNIHCVKQARAGIDKISSKNCLKYSGAKLQDKGVLISIEGLPESQLKNVHFEIMPTDNNGIFLVCGKFMGVEVEKVEVDVQNLLQLQYEGVGIMDIFGKAKININLLLYLLNKKYYKKI